MPESKLWRGFLQKQKKCGLLCLFSFWQKEIYSLNHFWWQKNRKNLTHPHFSLRIWASMPLWLGTSEKQRILTGVLKMSLLIKGICLQIAHGGCETGWRKKTMQCLLGKIHVLLNWRYFLWRIKLCLEFDQRQFSRIFLCSNKPIWRMLGQRHENLHNSTVCRI